MKPGTVANALGTTAAVTPAVTEHSSVTHWAVNLGPVTASIRYLHDNEITWSGVYVDDALAELVDERLATLATAERNLGDDRWMNRGTDPAVDALYDALNEQIALVKTAIAAEVLPLLTDVIDKNGRLTDRLEFSRKCGCTGCGCTPGVKAPYAARHGCPLQIAVSLTDPQQAQATDTPAGVS